MKLRVKPLDRETPGNGIATIDRESMATLGVNNGDFVTISHGNRTAVLRARLSQNRDRQRGIIGIDGQTRKTLGTRIDQLVEVSSADVEPAARLAVVIPEGLRIQGDIAAYIHDKLANRAVSPGKTVSVTMGFRSLNGSSNRRIPVKIVGSEPGGTVVVTDSTTIDIVEEPTDRDSEETEPADADPPGITYEDVGGLAAELDAVREMIELPMRHPELFQALGIEPPQGVLLHGPPGTGKTLIAKAVANEIDADFQTISGPEIMSKYYGESEERLREVFETAESEEPAIVFIDEIDSIAPKRGDTEGSVEHRVVAQLLSLMDGLGDHGQITVIGTTNRIDAVDPALRRGGRFDREIEVGAPDASGRGEILRIHTREMPLADDIDLDSYASNTHGFVGADLESVVREAGMNALRRVRPTLDLEAETIDAETLEQLAVTAADFRRALREVEPSALREVFVEAPDVTWDDVGGLTETKTRLQEAIQWPLAYPAAYQQVDLQSPTGILLHGPPGTGKTLLAKAVANEADSNFISVKGPELFDKYVGESEKGVREIFAKARENAPTVVFFDEIDAIAAQRGSGSDSQVSERVVSQLLTELDGLEALEEVVVIAATNRPELLDDALTRAGRIEEQIAVEEPDEAARREILSIHTRDRPVAGDVDLDALAAATEGFVGAEVAALCRTAATEAVRAHVHARNEGRPAVVEEMRLTRPGFEAALNEVSDEERTINWPARDDDATAVTEADSEATAGNTADEATDSAAGGDTDDTAVADDVPTDGADETREADPADAAVPPESGVESGGSTVDADESREESATDAETPAAVNAETTESEAEQKTDSDSGDTNEDEST
ncbi:AAA family ATPase [Halonotius aquaticus]|uniref:AAA family ATPase n=1 Tax=Halonotius aquaticus TaxID=2216978 RepID=A0A3A6PV31_9EURY|nr:CDC48 family AAA ATPase [Halonotius aquaticus]RJX43270.1 AAA family ATPase [Halonotius aquaticus]